MARLLFEHLGWVDSWNALNALLAAKTDALVAMDFRTVKSLKKLPDVLSEMNALDAIGIYLQDIPLLKPVMHKLTGLKALLIDCRGEPISLALIYQLFISQVSLKHIYLIPDTSGNEIIVNREQAFAMLMAGSGEDAARLAAEARQWGQDSDTQTRMFRTRDLIGDTPKSLDASQMTQLKSRIGRSMHDADRTFLLKLIDGLLFPEIVWPKVLALFIEDEKAEAFEALLAEVAADAVQFLKTSHPPESTPLPRSA